MVRVSGGRSELGYQREYMIVTRVMPHVESTAATSANSPSTPPLLSSSASSTKSTSFSFALASLPPPRVSSFHAAHHDGERSPYHSCPPASAPNIPSGTVMCAGACV